MLDRQCGQASQQDRLYLCQLPGVLNEQTEDVVGEEGPTVAEACTHHQTLVTLGQTSTLLPCEELKAILNLSSHAAKVCRTKKMGFSIHILNF